MKPSKGFSLMEMLLVMVLSLMVVSLLTKAIYFFETAYEKQAQRLLLAQRRLRLSVLLHDFFNDVNFFNCQLDVVPVIQWNNEAFFAKKTLGIDILSSQALMQMLALKQNRARTSEAIFIRKLSKYHGVLARTFHATQLVVQGLDPRFQKQSDVDLTDCQSSKAMYVNNVTIDYPDNEQRLLLKSSMSSLEKPGAMVFPYRIFTLYLAKNAQGIMSLYKKNQTGRNQLLVAGVYVMHYQPVVKEGQAWLRISAQLCVKTLCKKVSWMVSLLS